MKYHTTWNWIVVTEKDVKAAAMRVLVLADKNVSGETQGRFEEQGYLFQSIV